jgi:hypothetical protein
MAILMTMPAVGQTQNSYDMVIVGGTPGGIMAAIAAARNGCSAVILERSAHIGGLPANGLGATDIATRGATGGLFADLVGRVRKRYADKYGVDSRQVIDCSDGYHFEPHVGEQVFEEMLAEHRDRITVLRRRQFDAEPMNVVLKDGGLTGITVTNLDTKQPESYSGKVFIDATYEGDLAAAAGAEYRIGREGQSEFDEPMAGKLYKQWAGPIGPGSTGLGDNAVQAYNYRLCLTRDPKNLVPIEKPASYNRDEYVSLIDDVRLSRFPAPADSKRIAIAWDGIGRVTNMVALPNGKTDGNNQHAAFISTDLPEENWPWPTAGWEWRDRFAGRLRDYILGLLWFAQNDSELPEDFRARCREWGLAKDEYTDNGHFPRQAYVREGRRIVGEHLFTAHDALPVEPGTRPPVYADSITASHYALDSHAVLKREPGRVHLDGFFSKASAPYTVPYGVMVPQKIENLLTPVPVSGTHIGFSTLRMEPCWMALGEAAGTAAALSIKDSVTPRKVDIRKLQVNLLDHGAVLMYFRDASPGQDHYKALQMLALRGLFSGEWNAKLDEKIDEQTAARWIDKAAAGTPEAYKPGITTRGELLDMLYEKQR